MKSSKYVMTIECTYKFMYICTVCMKMYEFSKSFKCLKKILAGNCGTSSFSETRLFNCLIELKASKASLTTSHGYRIIASALKVNSTVVSYV